VPAVPELDLVRIRRFCDNRVLHEINLDPTGIFWG
jgi:hypothetical protein